MAKTVTHAYRFTIGPGDQDGYRYDSVSLAGPLVTWIDPDDGRWHVHPDGNDRFVGVASLLDLAVLDYLCQKLGADGDRVVESVARIGGVDGSGLES